MKDTLFDVEGKIFVITGGLGQLGAQFAKAALARGARVAVFGRNADEARMNRVFSGEELATGRLRCHEVDICSKETVEKAMEAIGGEWGVPHVLVNAAGIDTQPTAPPEVSGPFETFPEEVFREVVETNITGTFLCCQVIGGAMAREGRGSIINVGSIYGMLSPVQGIYAYKEEKTGVPFIKPVAYSASKSGVYNLTRYLATYWARKGVRVNTLTPSGVFREGQDEEFIANYTNRIPIGRMAQSDEFNGPVLFLASDASRYMTGANLVVDGGWTAW